MKEATWKNKREGRSRKLSHDLPVQVYLLGGGFKHFFFSPLFGDDFQF